MSNEISDTAVYDLRSLLTPLDKLVSTITLPREKNPIQGAGLVEEIEAQREYSLNTASIRHSETETVLGDCPDNDERVKAAAEEFLQSLKVIFGEQEHDCGIHSLKDMHADLEGLQKICNLLNVLTTWDQKEDGEIEAIIAPQPIAIRHR
ncbi:hypothetical protein M422DRAFT_71431 [Sphaerobolus stellatus SS14]|uniref:Uncharacterized protein n=1 Tax=Sphaerobolus stellatus (strain SS14) TaxID=990650 RepID=A0A0C9USR8_SPHS4|nr:hypothetical protein M422DRAFT_71431 [Sphaerobolus stellatus SS14]